MFNVGTGTDAIIIEVFTPAGVKIGSTAAILDAQEGMVLELTDPPRMPIAQDSYGVVRVSSLLDEPLYAETIQLVGDGVYIPVEVGQTLPAR